MRNFEFLEPRTVSEASRMLADHGETARPLAGGTALLLLIIAYKRCCLGKPEVRPLEL